MKKYNPTYSLPCGAYIRWLGHTAPLVEAMGSKSPCYHRGSGDHWPHEGCRPGSLEKKKTLNPNIYIVTKMHLQQIPSAAVASPISD